MGREQRPGDWAAWMGTPAPAPRDTGTARDEGPEPADPPAATGAPAVTGVAAAAAPEVVAEPDLHGGDPGRSARREATRQRVLDAAREVFAERGIIGGTVEDICERAGYTRGAFYSNFADKDDVLGALVAREHAILLEHLDASFALVDQEVAEAPDLASVLASIVDRILRSIPVDRQLSLVQTELEIHAIRRPDLSRQFVEANHSFRERIGEFIDEAMRRHGRELLVRPADITDTMLAVAERSVRRALLAGGGADPDALASAVLPGVLLALSRPSRAEPAT